MITMNQLQPERDKFVVYPLRLTVEQWEKCAQVGRVLGWAQVNGSGWVPVRGPKTANTPA